MISSELFMVKYYKVLEELAEDLFDIKDLQPIGSDLMRYRYIKRTVW